jgi:DNA-binding NtrC family response regulator
MSNHRILHVDDDPQFTRLIARRLHSRGFDVTPLHDPRQTIAELAGGHFRVVLMDIDMPQGDGLALLREIKAWDGGVQVIMLTGLVSMTTALQSLRWGAEACFFKPIDDVQPLVDALHDAIRKTQRWWVTLRELSQRRRCETCDALG